MASLKKVLRKKKYVKIKLKKIVTNHLEIKAKINGVKGRFILDTGASNSCVSDQLISHFNMEAEASETKASGAGATGMETQQSQNNRLAIGKWKMKDCHLVLFDLSHVNEALNQYNAKEVHGIIGADVLQLGKAVIDYDNMVLFLKKPKKIVIKKNQNSMNNPVPF